MAKLAGLVECWSFNQVLTVPFSSQPLRQNNPQQANFHTVLRFVQIRSHNTSKGYVFKLSTSSKLLAGHVDTIIQTNMTYMEEFSRSKSRQMCRSSSAVTLILRALNASTASVVVTRPRPSGSRPLNRDSSDSKDLVICNKMMIMRLV